MGFKLSGKIECDVTTCICFVDGNTIFISQPSRKIPKGFDIVFIVHKKLLHLSKRKPWPNSPHLLLIFLVEIMNCPVEKNVPSRIILSLSATKETNRKRIFSK